MDTEGLQVSVEPILQARSLVKRYGRVTALDHADFELYPGEILAVIGDNGAGKSSLIKALCGAVIPEERVKRALSRGQTPRYDKRQCLNLAATHRRRGPPKK